MPLKLSVGLTKKIGQPDYGSLGAAWHVELELDHGVLNGDPATFQQRARQAFTACCQAVNDELNRQTGSTIDTAVTAKPVLGASSGPSNPTTVNGCDAGHRASRKQLDYAKQLAGDVRGLGVRRLEDLAQTMFAKPLAGLTILDASGLIDMLNPHFPDDFPHLGTRFAQDL